MLYSTYVILNAYYGCHYLHVHRTFARKEFNFFQQGITVRITKLASQQLASFFE